LQVKLGKRKGWLAKEYLTGIKANNQGVKPTTAEKSAINYTEAEGSEAGGSEAGGSEGSASGSDGD
jgi:hypothetical protein